MTLNSNLINSNNSISIIPSGSTVVMSSSVGSLQYIPTVTTGTGTTGNGFSVAATQEYKKTIYTELQNLDKIKSALNITRNKINVAEEKFKLSAGIINDYRQSNKEALDISNRNLKELKVAAKELLKMCKEMQSLLNNEIMEEVIK